MMLPKLREKRIDMNHPGSECEVLEALEMYDTVLKPFIDLVLYELPNCPNIGSDDGVSTLSTRNGSFITDRHGLEVHISSDAIGNVRLFKMYKLPTKLLMSSTITTSRILWNHVPTSSSLLSRGFFIGTLDRENPLNSTVQLDFSPARRIMNPEELRANPEECNFKLLLDMDTDLIVPYVLHSLIAVQYGIQMEIHYKRGEMYAFELMYKQLKRALNDRSR